MSQHDMVIANAPGATVRADINAALAALVGQNNGASAPSTTYPFMFWFDTANSLLKMRDAADSAWVTVASLSGTTWIPYRSGSALGTAAVESVAAGGSGDLLRADGSAASLTGLLAQTIASQAEAEAGTENTKRMTPLRVAQAIAALASGGMKVGGSLTLTSGTGGTITDFGGVSDPDRIEIDVRDLDPSGSDHLYITIGDSGGEETTGYDTRSIGLASGGGTQINDTSAFEVRLGSGASLHGQVIMKRLTGNVWGFAFNGHDGANNVIAYGFKELSGTIDRVVFGWSGSNTFSGANGAAYLSAGDYA